MPIEILIAMTAFFAGALIGMTGVGGGALMTPALILLFGISPVVAIATDLIYATVVKLVAAAIHSKFGSIDWTAAKKMWIGSIPGTLIGIIVLIYLANEVIIGVSLILSILLISTGFSMLFSTGYAAKKNGRPQIIGGGLVGFAVATTSVGAGAIGMVLLKRLVGDDQPKRLVGTDIVHAIPIAFIAGLSYLFAGFFDLFLFLSLMAGSLPGVIVGSLMVGRINQNAFRKVLGGWLILASILVALSVIGPNV